jgi:hypothetical protein
MIWRIGDKVALSPVACLPHSRRRGRKIGKERKGAGIRTQVYQKVKHQSNLFREKCRTSLVGRELPMV